MTRPTRRHRWLRLLAAAGALAIAGEPAAAGPANAGPIDEAARAEIQRVRWRSDDGEILMALGWFAVPHEDMGTVLTHRGRTPGHVAVISFVPERRTGVALLANRGGRETSLALAELAERLLLHLTSTAPADGRREETR